MKKTLSLAFIGLSLMAFSQVSVSAKANVLLENNSPKWSNIRETIKNSGEKATGFNAGLSAKVDFPATSFFVMPEIYFTHFKNTYTEPLTKTKLKANTSRVDLPILLGYNILSDNISVFTGPVLSYNLAKENQWNDFKENAQNKFTIGYQIGGQVIFSDIIISAKYEGRFSKDQRDFINKVISKTIRYDNRPNFIMLGLGYQF